MTTNKRLDDFRKHKDDYFASGSHSPLDHEQQHDFHGLSYFAYNPELQFEVPIDAAENQGASITLDTSDGQKVEFQIAGKVRFLAGEGDGGFELTLLKDYDRGRFFLPFADPTNGLETYKGGRYIDPQEKPGGTISIDFNYAYNPYCAYGEGWSCPLPPEENKLSVEIRAGEKAFPQAAEHA